MKPKKGDTVKLFCRCGSKSVVKGETGVVEEVFSDGFIHLEEMSSCGCIGFYSKEYKIISKKEVKMGRKYEFSKEGLKIGDIVVNIGGDKRKVIEVLENSFATSFCNDLDEGYFWHQFREAIEYGWTIEQPVKPKSKATLKKISEAKKFLKEQGELND